jgi:hypothetical protein
LLTARSFRSLRRRDSTGNYAHVQVAIWSSGTKNNLPGSR